MRELENTMHRAVLMSQEAEIEPLAVMLSGQKAATAAQTAVIAAQTATEKQSPQTAATDPSMVGRTVADVEKDLILNTLQHCLGNRTHAANILGISIRTLRNKLKQYNDEGIRVPEAS